MVRRVFPAVCANRSWSLMDRMIRNSSLRLSSTIDDDSTGLITVAASTAEMSALPKIDECQQQQDDEEWIHQMMNYLSSKKDVIFRGENKNVAVIVSSSPSGECFEIASAIAGIAASENAEEICFVVSPQEDDGDRGINNNSSNDDIETERNMVESIYFDDEVVTEEIEVVVLATKSWRVVHDDSFVNDFLRRTDAWIHMGSEFADDFCLHARLQEGANITLW